MATEDGEDAQRAEKVGLKRKLTGPPRLLLGKTRTRSVGEDMPEVQAKKDVGETGELPESPNMEEYVSSEVNVESCRVHSEDAAEDKDIRNRKVTRRRWLRRFRYVFVCIRRQKKNVEESSDKLQNQEADAAEENRGSVSKERRRCNMRFRTSSNIQTCEQRKDADKPSLTFRKKLRRFFTSGGRSRPGLALRNMEDMRRIEETPCLPDELQRDRTSQSSEAVMVTAEMDVQLTEDRAAAESPEESPTEVTEEDLTADRPDTIQTDCEVVEVAADTDEVPAEDLIDAVSPERDKVFSSEVVLDLDDHLSATVSSEEKTDRTACRSLQPSTNGPSIRIELVPPDDVALEDEEEEEECWEGSSSSENQNHLLLLLGFDHSEWQLLQMACSLVRAAMNAAVDQLTREQQSSSDHVHREPQGCRDHA